MWIVITVGCETCDEPEALPHVYNSIGRVKKGIEAYQKNLLEVYETDKLDPVELEKIEADAGAYYFGYAEDTGLRYYVYSVTPEGE